MLLCGIDILVNGYIDRCLSSNILYTSNSLVNQYVFPQVETLPMLSPHVVSIDEFSCSLIEMYIHKKWAIIQGVDIIQIIKLKLEIFAELHRPELRLLLPISQ